MTNTTKHRINDRSTVLRAEQVTEGMVLNHIMLAGMAFAPSFGHGRVTRIFDGHNGYRVLSFDAGLVTVPDHAEVWVTDPEGIYA